MTTARRALALTTTALTFATAASMVPAQAAAPTAGPGWALVALGRPDAGGEVTGTMTVTMVSPTGVQRTVARLGSAWRITDITPDGRLAVVGTPAMGRPSWKVLDTRTGRLGNIRGNWMHVAFTNPSGKGLLARANRSEGTGPVSRLALDGGLQKTFPGTADGEGLAQTMDGRYLLTTSANGALQLHSNSTGRLVRTFAKPAGAQVCSFGHSLSNTQFTATCWTPSGAQVYRYTTTSSRPVALTAKISRRGDFRFGFADLWSTSRGQVASVEPSCGNRRPALVKGSTAAFIGGRGAQTLTVVGTSTYQLQHSSECVQSATSLVRHDLATGRTTVLAGAGRNRGMVVADAMVIDPRS